MDHRQYLVDFSIPDGAPLCSCGRPAIWTLSKWNQAIKGFEIHSFVCAYCADISTFTTISELAKPKGIDNYLL